jgi:hypothetical protein
VVAVGGQPPQFPGGGLLPQGLGGQFPQMAGGALHLQGPDGAQPPQGPADGVLPPQEPAGKQERVANEKLLLQVRSEEVQLQKKRDEERIMTMDLTALPEDQKTYYMFLRSQIMSQFSTPST